MTDYIILQSKIYQNLSLLTWWTACVMLYWSLECLLEWRCPRKVSRIYMVEYSIIFIDKNSLNTQYMNLVSLNLNLNCHWLVALRSKNRWKSLSKGRIKFSYQSGSISIHLVKGFVVLHLSFCNENRYVNK